MSLRVVVFGAGDAANSALLTIGRINAAAPTFVVIGCFDGGAPDDHDPDCCETAGCEPDSADTTSGTSLPDRICRLDRLGADRWVAAVRSGRQRQTLARSVPNGMVSPVLVDPTVTVGRGVEVGEGTMLMAFCLVEPTAAIGRHVSTGFHVAMGHGSVVGDFATIGPGAAILGDVVVGEGVTVGANAVLREGVTVGPWATVGAGAIVVRDVAPGATVLGAPAREPERGSGRVIR